MIIPGGQGEREGGGGRASATPLGKLPALAEGSPHPARQTSPPNHPTNPGHERPQPGAAGTAGCCPRGQAGIVLCPATASGWSPGWHVGTLPVPPRREAWEGAGAWVWVALGCRAVPCHQHPEQDEPALPLATSPLRAPPRLSTTEWLILPLSAGLITQPERGSFPSAFQAGKLDALAIFKKYGGKEGREAKEGRKVFYLPAGSQQVACAGFRRAE